MQDITFYVRIKPKLGCFLLYFFSCPVQEMVFVLPKETFKNAFPLGFTSIVTCNVSAAVFTLNAIVICCLSSLKIAL